MIKNNYKKKSIIALCVFSGLIYALAIVFGGQIYRYHNFDRILAGSFAISKTLILLVGIIAVVAIVLFFCFNIFLKNCVYREVDTVNDSVGRWLSHPIKGWLIGWAVIFTSWTPAYLAYYPGMLSYDAPEQICIWMGVFPATTHQPPIHTIILGLCLDLGQSIGIEPVIIYTLIQMVYFSAFFSYFMFFLTKNFVRKSWELLLLLLFFVINPIMPLMALQTTKDIPFTCTFVLSVIFIYKLVTKPNELKWYNYVFFASTLILTSLFRNNAFYAILVSGVIIVLFVKADKTVKAKTIVAFVVAIICVKAITGPVYTKLGYEKADDKVEMSAVPMQQLALVIREHSDEITEEEWVDISRYIGNVSTVFEAYNPRFYDPLKDAIYKTNLQEDYTGFLRLWGHFLKRYPVEYLRAFLDLNIPYWYQFADSIDPYSNRIYIETDIGGSPYQFERASKLPGLLAIYESIANYSALDKPVLRILFAINTPFWLMMLGIVLLIVKRDYRKIVVFMPALLLWGTYLLGPVSNFRYIFPIFVLYPLFVGIVFQQNIEERI